MNTITGGPAGRMGRIGLLVGLALVSVLVGCRGESAAPRPGSASGGASAGLPPPLPALGFLDITAASGITFRHSIGDDDLSNLIEAVGGGAAFLDYDQDGDLDLYAVSGRHFAGVSDGPAPSGSSPNRLYRNRGDGVFDEVTAEAGVAGAGYGMGVAVGDYDDDGDPDLYLINYGANLLYRNNGDGTFTDVTAEAGVGDEGAGVGGAFLDYDNDGRLDLYVGNYVEFDPSYHYYYAPDSFPGPLDYPGQPDVLYRNRGDGTFEEVTEALGVFDRDGRAMGVGIADVDEDGRADIYVSNDAMANFLYHNRDGKRFEEIGLRAGVAYNQSGDTTASMVVDFGDYDNDGDEDLFVSDDSYGALYRNEGGLLFTDVTTEAGVAEPKGQYVSWGCSFLDYDNDGDLDLFTINGALHHLFGEEDMLLENDGTGRFTDISRQRGDYFHQKYVGRGGCFGDIDNDGDLDVFVVNLNEPGRLLRNDGGNQNSWLLLRLVGTRSARDAIGARVKVTCGERVWSRQRKWGGGYLSCNDPRIHFGLGQAETVDRIEIWWPAGIHQVMENVPARQILTVTEPES